MNKVESLMVDGGNPTTVKPDDYNSGAQAWIWSIWFYLQCSEFSLSALSIVTTSLVTAVFIRFRPFHGNLAWLLSNMIVQFYVHVIAGLWLFYQIVEFPNKPIGLLYFLMQSLRFIALAGAALGTPSMVLERAAATWYIADYEYRSRRFIPCSIIVVQWTVMFAFRLAIAYGRITDLHLLILIACLNGIGLGSFFFVEHWNRTSLADLSHVTAYSLSQRFQLSENVRTCKVIRRGVILGAVICTILAMMFIPAVVIRNNNVLFLFMQLALTIVPLYAIALAMLPFTTDDRWRFELKAMLRSIFCSKKLRKNQTEDRRKLRANDGRVMFFTVNEEMEMYFADLHKMWS